jgi:CheY-like chemotaxis protein
MQDTQRKILLLEDDYESMRDLKEYIEEVFGWKVELTADAGLPGRLKSERFDLIVLDLMIHPTSLDASGQEVPNVHFDGINWQRTGLEFLQRLRRGEYAGAGNQGTPPNVPALALSAVASFSEDPFKSDPTFRGYVEKPFRLEDMIQRIRLILQE